MWHRMPWLSFLVLVSLALCSHPAVAAPVQVVDWQPVELDDSRVLAMSPNGQWLATLRHVAGQRPEACVIAANTFTERLCMDLSGFDAGLRADGVTWSPDSRRIVFDEEIYRTIRDGDLWVLDVATGTVTHLADDGYRGALPSDDNLPSSDVYLDTDPAWSPDGTELVFVRTTWKGAASPTRIVRLGIYGGTETTIVDFKNGKDAVFVTPRWSPDGKQIVYSEMSLDAGDSRNGIWTVGLDGQPPRQIVGVDPERGAPTLAEVSAHADKALVLYPRSLQMFDLNPWALLDLATGATTVLEAPARGSATSKPDPFAVTALATFSPDGDAVLLASWIGDFSDLYAVTIESGEMTPLIEGMDAVSALRPLGGLTWASNATIYVPTGDTGGRILKLDRG